ncbi:hypothetical protein SUGI_0047680 [Cryptomeria japonica]|nr:hypothetical protein SUGI_0047680 [Cryptomeria japonica]
MIENGRDERHESSRNRRFKSTLKVASAPWSVWGPHTEGPTWPRASKSSASGLEATASRFTSRGNAVAMVTSGAIRGGKWEAQLGLASFSAMLFKKGGRGTPEKQLNNLLE